MPQYTIHLSTTFPNNGNTGDVWGTNTIANDEPQLLACLSPLNPSLQHWNIQERHADRVGESFSETEEISRWYAGSERGEGERAVIFSGGDPGVGNITLAGIAYLIFKSEVYGFIG